VKQGNVSELLRGSEQIEVRLDREDETQYALSLLQQMRTQADWLTNVVIERNKQGKLLLMLDAPTARSAEVNAFLARQHLFAAELHPRQGSLEEVFLELTAPPAPAGSRPGMEALASLPVEPIPTSENSGKRGNL
jgi:ABC-2 type transport system ATP-binding protein